MERKWGNRIGQTSGGSVARGIRVSPCLVHRFPCSISIGFVCLTIHNSQVPSFYIYLCFVFQNESLTDSRVENREKERERERGKSLGKLWEMGGSAKQIWILHTKILYFFADSTHSYDFLWFLSFHSPLHRYCNSCNLNYIHLSGKLFFLGS